jgi:hypothetical protein
MTANTKVSLNPNWVARILGGLAFFLVIDSTVAVLTDYYTGHASSFAHKVVKLLYVDLEMNVPAFFSMSLLLFAAVLLAAITVFKKKQMDRYVMHWAILSCGFLFMSFDEIVAVHERLIEPMRAILGEEHLGILYFAWVVPAIALVSFLAVFFLRFLMSLPTKTRLSFLLAASLYIGAAIGLELIEGWHSEIYGKENLIYIALTTIEEALEMTGAIVFIWSLLGYIADNFKEVRLQFSDFASNSQ